MRIIIKKARIQIIDFNFLLKFWVKLINIIVYLKI